MCPIYAVLAAPLSRPLGVPVLLWYTHWNRTRTLELAERVATAVVSVDRRSFPIESPKVHAIGHGIDLDEFPCREHMPDHGNLRAVVLGRYSPAKGLDVVLRAVRRALDDGVDIRLEVFGPALTGEERTHRRELEELVRALELTKRVKLGHAVLRAEVPQVLARADVLVNNMRAGAPDKVVYEACASCVPVLASNPVFDELLPPELRFTREDPEDLARGLAGRPAGERVALGRGLRLGVAERHSVDSWAEAILRIAT
jgi:glycosyltransferase involved in cell wall biosynthesis